MNATVKDSGLRLPDIFPDFPQAGDASGLVSLFAGFLGHFSLGPFALAEVRSANIDWRDNLILGTIPESYLDQYWAERSIFDSPLFLTCLHVCRPIPLSQIYERKKLTKRGEAIYNRAAQYGLGEGYAFPLKGRCNRPALMLVAGDFQDIDRDTFLYIEIAAIEFYHRACTLFPESEEPHGRPHQPLSQRERETLTWAAKGKTDWEIAQLLGISERTVHYHIENAKKKMMVPTRLQAVVEAIKTLEILV